MKWYLPVILCLLPSAASAHIGFSRFDAVEGLLNPFLSMNTLLLPVATGLWLAFSRVSNRSRLLVFSTAVLAGSTAQLMGFTIVNSAQIVFGCVILTGLAAVFAWAAPFWLTVIWLTFSGWSLGQLNLVGETGQLQEPYLFATGVAVGSGILAVYFAAMIRAKRFEWLPIAGRVLASWITAASLMVWVLQTRG